MVVAIKKPCLENEIAILENENRMVSQLHFHPFDSVALVADDHDGSLSSHPDRNYKALIS